MTLPFLLGVREGEALSVSGDPATHVPRQGMYWRSQ